MAASIELLSELCGADPRDIRALLAMYPDDVDDLWEEEGVVSRVGMAEVHDRLDPLCMRSMPEMFRPPHYFSPPAHYLMTDW